ncbi:G-type lectin S-receptor-like serine/threonine-protein kinase B120 [Phragmites australis]|uniref:G-type lectin S-receptor-like serine/threonine-protein kinase B120 n=1 Tax=Phragmites australis TaxID=29695 RepID=UPI002D780CEC|nr:G-type lectin S-receptor-like serine/threonine-protein kinase B120 [Phragmites australis]
MRPAPLMAHAAVAGLALLSLLYAHVGHVGGAAATLSQGQSLGANDALVSANGAFTLAFFAPRGGDPSRRYLGVMYAQAAEQTVPWVANRDAPLSAASGDYSAAVTASGELQVLEGERVVWRTNTSSLLGNVTLTILDNGNLMLSAGGAQEVLIWQSFDHPADTFLPGMSIALDRRNGIPVNRTLFTSWRSPIDPGPGNFTLGLDPFGSAQLYIWRSQGGENTTYWRSGQWANTNFVGIPWRSLYVYGFKLNGDPSQSNGVMSYTFNTYNSSLYRFMLHPNGTETCYMLLGTGDWKTVWSQPTIPCQTYNMCGANAECAAGDNGQAICSCLKGFEPRSAAEYSSGNWTQGCVRSAPLTCETKVSGGDGFADLPGVKLPNFATWESTVGDADACKQSCFANCSCGAYSYSTGTGCLTWGQELVDIYQFPNGGGYDLHIKVPASLLGSTTKRWTTIVIIVVIVVVVVFGACGLLLCKCRRRIKEKLGIVGRKKTTPPSLLLGMEAWQDFSGPKQPDQEEGEDGKKCELPLFAFEILAAATGDFSSANKLGEGGFGHVYKGRLPSGEEIAVKRLSQSSGQGLEEFKNEVILIAKLQHRNLVRLLGFCIQGEEKILVYEYMANTSLDAFLFDPARRGLLDWKTRFHIIEGIARGLLYLHRDSRLRVVHRDLKASNILLDRDMNPKISDFGMARIFGGDQNQVNTNRVVGTLGYMSPEYAMEGLFSVRSDVYSFGILILEIISGQKNSSFHHMEGSLNIVGYAWQLWNADKGEQLIDPSIRGTCSAREALRCVHMALLCVQNHACDRPDIPYVVLALGSDSSVLPMPRPPTFTLQCTSSDGEGLFIREKADESYSASDLTVTVLQSR